jgi:hypothetical protein
MAIAVGLIAIKGDGRWEDTFFNFAGIMAPIVAVIPTDAFGQACSPSELGVDVRTGDGEWTALLQASIDNNIKTLIITGFVGLAVAAVLSMYAEKSVLAPATVGDPGLRLGLFVTLLLLAVLTGAYLWWDDFSDRAHGWSAALMFVLLAAGIAANAHQRAGKTERRTYLIVYASIVTGMVVSGVIIWLIPDPWEHRILILETVEIAWFAAFWIVQTYELWNEPRLPSDDTSRTPAPSKAPIGEQQGGPQVPVSATVMIS